MGDGRRKKGGKLLTIELGVSALGAVQGDVLNADEILARRGIARKGEGLVGLIPGAPVGVGEVAAGGSADQSLLNLEPIAVASVLAHVTRSPGHVDGGRSGVENLAAVPQAEPDAVAWVDLVDFGPARVGEGSRVAAEVVAGLEELLGGHDEVAVLADVLPVVGHPAVDDELAVAVVSLDTLCGRKGPEGNASNAEMHGDGWRRRKRRRGCFPGCLARPGGIMVRGRLASYTFSYVQHTS